MKNYICDGDNIAITATGAIASGQLHLVGSKVLVATTAAAASGDVYTAKTEGVFEVPKEVGAITVGQKLYLLSGGSSVTTTASGNTLVGWAYSAAASGDTTVQISINENV